MFKLKNKSKPNDMPQEGKPGSMNSFIIFSATLFLIILLTGSVAFIFSMRQIIRANKSNELSQMLEIERIQLETFVNSEISITVKLANSPLVRQYFEDPENLELEKIVFREMAAYRRAFAGNSVFWINDIDKIFYSDDNDPYLLDPINPDNYWYSMTLDHTDTYNFNINYNPDLNVTNLWINAPVFDRDGLPIGAVGTSFELSGFLDMIYRDFTGRADIYFFNEFGEITGAKNIELVMNFQKWKSL